MGKKIKESTVAGSIAPVAHSMHTDSRSPVGQGVYGKTKAGSLLKGKKTSKKFANSAPVLESEQVNEFLGLGGDKKAAKPARSFRPAYADEIGTNIQADGSIRKMPRQPKAYDSEIGTDVRRTPQRAAAGATRTAPSALPKLSQADDQPDSAGLSFKSPLEKFDSKVLMKLPDADLKQYYDWYDHAATSPGKKATHATKIIYTRLYDEMAARGKVPPRENSEETLHEMFGMFKKKEANKPKQVAVTVDKDKGKVAFSELGKNAPFDPHKTTPVLKAYFDTMRKMKKNEPKLFAKVFERNLTAFEDALKQHGGKNIHNLDHLKVLNYIENLTITESDLSEELLAKKLAQDLKVFKRPRDREISKRSRDRDILPKTEDTKLPTAGAGAVSGTVTDTSANKDSALNTATNIAGNAQLATSLAAPALTKLGATAAGSLASRAVPGLGLVAGGLDAWRRAKEGDYTGAALSAGSGLAAMVPVVGTAASLGLTGAQIARDVYRAGQQPQAGAAPAQPATAKPAAQAQTAAPAKQAASTAAQPAASPSNFKQAFAAARKGGSGTFTYNGKQYNTQLAEQALTKMKKIKPKLKQDKLTPHEKFKGSVKRAGYDMDAGANRLLKLLDKQAGERAKRDKEEVNEWVSDREMHNPQPALSTMESSQWALGKEPSKQDMIRSFVEKGKSAESGAAAWERIYGGAKRKAPDLMKKKLKPPVKSHHEVVNEGRVKDLAMAIEELTREGKTIEEIAKELDVSKMIISKFKEQMDRIDTPVVGKLTERDAAEYDDESGMAHNQLKTIARAVHGLGDTIDDGDNLPEWVQKKLALAEDHLVTIWDYLQSENDDEIMEGTDSKFVVTCYNSLTDNKETILVKADDEYDAKDKVNYSLGLGSRVVDIRPAHGDEPTDREYKSYKNPSTGQLRTGIFDRDRGVTEGKADPVGSWVVYDGGKVKRFKSRDSAKAYAEKNGGKVASSEHYADKIQKQGVAEGLGKNIKRAAQGWGGAQDKPANIVKRNKAHDIDTAKKLRAGMDDAPEHTPQGLQKRVLDRKLKGVSEAQQCPECGGAAYDNEMIAEERDACYSKVKSRYKVWPSAYASGALVKCRKVGAKNWGNKSKKK